MKLQPTIMFTMRNNYESSDLTIPKDIRKCSRVFSSVTAAKALFKLAC